VVKFDRKDSRIRRLGINEHEGPSAVYYLS
jgi:hypothetical protein